MKGLKGSAYKNTRQSLEPLRQKKMKALGNKNRILAKFKQSVENYKRVKAG